MSGQLLAFPAAARRAPALMDRPVSRPFSPAPREYDLLAVARLTGMGHCSRKVLIGTLRKLAEQSGMPLPKTPRVHGGSICTGPTMIGARSRWDAMAFDAWLDGWTTPPPAASGVLAAARAEAGAHVRTAMAERAAMLGALGRKRA